MELTKQRKKEIVNQLLNDANSVYDYYIRVNKETFLNEEESSLVKEKLSKHFDIVDSGRDLFIKNVSFSLKNAKENYPEISKEMKDTIKKELSFIKRNASFIAIGGLVAGPALMVTMATVAVITPPVMLLSGAMGFAGAMPLGMKITEKFGVGISNKEKAELKALLNYEFGLSTNSMVNSNEETTKRKKPVF